MGNVLQIGLVYFYMEYTHEIQRFGQKLKCFIYKNIEEQNGKVYIRTEDGRACWWDKNIVTIKKNKITIDDKKSTN